MGLYLKYALESQENDCTRIACGIISDLSGSLGDGMNAYLGDFVPQIHNVLKDEAIDRSIKLNAMMAIGDICTY